MKGKTALGVLVAALFAAGLLAGSWRNANAPSATELTLQTACDVTRTQCAIQGDGLNLTLKLAPAPAVMEPFMVTLTDQDGRALQLDEAIVSFNMVGMDMGLNRYRLTAQGDGSWQGKATLPVCATGRRDWQADLLLSTPAGKTYHVQTEFVTQ